MPRKKAIKIIEDVKAEEVKQEEPTKMDISLLKDDNIQAIDTYLIGVKIYSKKATLEELNNYRLTISKINNNLTHSIQSLMNYSDKVNELNTSIEQQIIKLQTQLLQPKNKKFNNLIDLVKCITNEDQVKRLYKILPDNEDYAKVYLQGYVQNADPKKPNLLGTIKILGQYNFKKEERESYDIKVMKNEASTFWCSCIDHKLNSAKKSTVCKHIAFIVCKVMKVLELGFFETKVLSNEQIQTLLNRFSDKSDLWKNMDFVRDVKQLTLDTFKNFPIPIDDVCTFCYDDMTDKDINISVCCPACRHCYHSECIDIWLESYARCSICSSEIWKHFKTVKSGGIVSISNEL